MNAIANNMPTANRANLTLFIKTPLLDELKNSIQGFEILANPGSDKSEGNNICQKTPLV